MDKKISIVNTRDNEFEFDISIDGVDKKNMMVSFVIKTDSVNLQFPCKENEDNADKWEVVVPPMPMLELATYPFCVTIVVDGYFFEPFKGTAVVIHEPTVKTTATKKMSPPVVKSVTMKSDEDEEEVEEETKPVVKKKTAKKKAPVKRAKKKKTVEPEEKPDIKEEVEEEPITLDPNDMGDEAVEDIVVEEPVVETPPERDTFGDMASMLLNKHRPPSSGNNKKEDAVRDVLEGLNDLPASVAKKKVPKSKHGTFASTFDSPLLEKESTSGKGKKDMAVQEILLGTKKN